MQPDLSGPALRAAFFERCLGWHRGEYENVWLDSQGQFAKYGKSDKQLPPVDSDPTACFAWVVPWIRERCGELEMYAQHEWTVTARWLADGRPGGRLHAKEIDPSLPTALCRLALRIKESEQG